MEEDSLVEDSNNTTEESSDSTSGTVEDIKVKRVPKIGFFKRIIKDGSSLSLIRVIGTALTAVSMALISSRLTTIVNSFVLVGVISIGTAILSEFYRVVLSITSLGAKRVVVPVLAGLNVAPGVLIPSTDAVDTLTSEIQIVSEQPKRNWFVSGVHYLWNNPVFRMIALFAVVGTLTITVSYFVSNASEKIETTYTTINKTQSLSQKEKDKIANDAAKKTAQDFADLRSQIESLEANNQTLRNRISALELGKTSHSDQLEELLKQLEEVSKKIDETSKKVDDFSRTEPSDTNTSNEPEPSDSASATDEDSDPGETTSDSGNSESRSSSAQEADDRTSS